MKHKRIQITVRALSVILLLFFAANYAGILDNISNWLSGSKVNIALHQTREKTHLIITPEGARVILPQDAIDIPKTTVESNNSYQALFSPDDDLRTALIELIDQELTSVHVAIYAFTDLNIAQALIQAANRGVDVQVVSDASGIKDKYNKIGLLCDKGIPVYLYQGPRDQKYSSLMHNKFVLFAQNKNNHSLVWTGSFNFTKTACMSNQENIIIVDNKKIYKQFEKQFEKLKERSNRYGKKTKSRKLG